MGYWISKTLHLWTNTWLERRSKTPGSLVGAYLWRPGHGFWCRNQERQGVTEIKRQRATFLRLTLALINTIETYHLKLKLGLNSVILFWDPVVFSQQLQFLVAGYTFQIYGRQEIPWSCPGSVPPVKFGYWRSSTTKFFICFSSFQNHIFFLCQMKRSGFMDFHGFSFMLVQNSSSNSASHFHLSFTEKPKQHPIIWTQADLWTSSPLFNDIFRTRKI